MTVAELPITIDQCQVEKFCRQRGIRRLSLFGSVLREDFVPGRSDVDVYAEFDHGALRGIGLDYFGYADELAHVPGQPVDFCANLNRYILPKVEQELLPIYERP